MDWHNYNTSYTLHNRVYGHYKETEVNYLKEACQEMIEVGRHSFALQLDCELRWVNHKRPFYNVWPSIAEGLVKVPLDIPCKGFIDQLPNVLDSILIRFAKGHELVVEGEKIHYFLFCRGRMGRGHRGLFVYVYAGQKTKVSKVLGKTVVSPEGVPVYWNIRVSLEEGTLENSLKTFQDKELTSKEQRVCEAALRVGLGICLMAGNHELVDPIVLSKDKDKYIKTGDVKYIQKAQRRGLIGYNVGSHIEINPHYRRPHFGLRWTGLNRRIPKIVPIKGTIVKKHKITQVPTGYLGE